jgi:hypothetical protein
MSGFAAVFGNPHAGSPVGGGVTPGQEPWNSPTPTTTVTINRQPKPMILAGAVAPENLSMFLNTMAKILAPRLGGDAFVEEGAVPGVIYDGGIRWLPDFGRYNFGALSIALENAGFDPVRCALQPFLNVVGGVSGHVGWKGHGQMAVRLLHGPVGNERVYEGAHDVELSLASPMIFAQEIKTFMRL